MKPKIRPSYRYTFGKYKGRTVAQTPHWYNYWAYHHADLLKEEDRYIISIYLKSQYRPKEKPTQPF